MSSLEIEMDVLIAPATVADLDAIDVIEQHSFPRPWPRSTFERELINENARIDVARIADTIIAFNNYWIVAHELHILAIATHPDHRRHGVGRQLLAHAIAAAGVAGCTLATLEVRRGNLPAIAMYARAGFKVTHVRARYYHDDEDALVMLATI
ncbi:MAG: ribosomal protein S18-alanine N-acetyltransferase [Proteobacteria bacterium]|nr:ribosomal protein S18-alanine N-acetyltransferase [Pseudomonadota bacterium]